MVIYTNKQVKDLLKEDFDLNTLDDNLINDFVDHLNDEKIQTLFGGTQPRPIAEEICYEFHTYIF